MHRKGGIHVFQASLDGFDVIRNVIETEPSENPIFSCDLNDIIQKYLIWKSTMTRIRPFYAVKCNNHPVVLSTLAALGIGFDCASKSEIHKILSLGVEPQRIIYANTVKHPDHLRYAANNNVQLVTFDNELELQKLKKLHPNCRAVIRIKCDDEDISIKMGCKFGCDVFSEAPNLLKTAQRLGVRLIGVSFHIGNFLPQPSTFAKAIEAARFVFDKASEIGMQLNLLDIGGGFPGRDGIAVAPLLEKFAGVINRALDLHFGDVEALEIIAEPGTYFVESAFKLACTIHSAKEVQNEDSPMYMYYLNDGLHGSFGLTMSHKVIRTARPLKLFSKKERLYPSTLWGPTCNSVDKIAENVLLPKMELGDLLIFENLGNYSITMASSFNEFPKPKVYDFIHEKNWKYLKNSMFLGGIKISWHKYDFKTKVSEFT